MRCPFCGSEDTQVKDSRPVDDGSAIRRRRQCAICGARFTTFERVQLRDLAVVKKDGRRVPFDRDKSTRSIGIATRKRGIDEEQIERMVNGIVRRIETTGETEVPSTRIGELAMESLAQLDEVAYVRFASVYRDFATARDFEEFIRRLPEDLTPRPARHVPRSPAPIDERSRLSLHGHGDGSGGAWARQRLAQPGRRLCPGQGRARRRAAAGRSPVGGRTRRARRSTGPAMPRVAARPMSRSSPARITAARRPAPT